MIAQVMQRKVSTQTLQLRGEIGRKFVVGKLSACIVYALDLLI